MKYIQIAKENYTEILVNMLFKATKIHPHTLFLTVLVKNSDNLGRLLRFEIIPILREELKINKELIKKTINTLRKNGDIIEIKGHTIYLHPKYMKAKDSDPKYGGDGLFVFCSTGFKTNIINNP